jgi:hypothetical protein
MAALEWSGADAAAVALAYEPWPLDTLYVWFGRKARPGYYVPMAAGELPIDGLMLKVALDSEVAIGLMVEGYLADGLSRPASWMAVAPFAGIAPETLATFGLAAPEAVGGRDEAVTTFLADVRDALNQLAGVEDGRLPAIG